MPQLLEAGDRKCHIHDNACHEAGITFIPLVAESFGGWSREGADTIRAIGKHQALRLAARKNTPTQIQKRESGDETRISPTEFVDGSVYVNMDVRRVDFKPIPLQATNQLVHSVWRVNVTIFFFCELQELRGKLLPVVIAELKRVLIIIYNKFKRSHPLWLKVKHGRTDQKRIARTSFLAFC